jgi:hypothetical protein
MSVVNADVQSIAQNALNGYKNHNNCVRIAKALGSVIDSRQAGFESDSAAAADHYLNMRLLTAFDMTLYPVGVTMIYGYDLLKDSLDYLSDGLRSILGESKSPPSKPSPEIRAWAFRGLNDGLGDWPGVWRSSDDMTVPASPDA